MDTEVVVRVGRCAIPALMNHQQNENEVCVCVCVCVCVGGHFTVSMFSNWKVWRGKVCGKRGVPFQLSGRKRRGNAARGSDGIAQGKHFNSVTRLPSPTTHTHTHTHTHTSLPPLVPRKHSDLTPSSPWPDSQSSTQSLRSSSDGTSPDGRPLPGQARIVSEASYRCTARPPGEWTEPQWAWTTRSF